MEEVAVEMTVENLKISIEIINYETIKQMISIAYQRFPASEIVGQ